MSAVDELRKKTEYYYQQEHEQDPRSEATLEKITEAKDIVAA